MTDKIPMERIREICQPFGGKLPEVLYDFWYKAGYSDAKKPGEIPQPFVTELFRIAYMDGWNDCKKLLEKSYDTK